MSSHMQYLQRIPQFSCSVREGAEGRLEEAVEEFSVQQVLTERPVEAFEVGVLPRSTRLDEPSVDILR